MATLLKDTLGRSPFWICAYTSPDGRRLKKSTKVRIAPTKGQGKSAGQLRDEAMGVCLKWAQLATVGKAKTITESQARRVVSEIYEMSTGETLHFRSCKEWLETWIASKDGAAAPGTLTKYQQVIDEFIEHLSDKAEKSFGSISPADIIAFQKTMRNRKLAASTINLAIKKTLNAPFSEAHRLGYIPINPVAGVKSLKDDVHASRDVFTADQLSALIKSAKDTDWLGAIFCGATTGLRLGDVASLV